MLRDPPIPGSPSHWLIRDRSNLARAKQPKPPEVFWEDLCFDAQQAAEMALKAVLLHRAIPFRFVHDLAELITLLEEHLGPLPEPVRASAALTDYAVEARYPGPYEAVTREEHEEAVSLADAVLHWAEVQLRSP